MTKEDWAKLVFASRKNLAWIVSLFAPHKEETLLKAYEEGSLNELYLCFSEARVKAPHSRVLRSLKGWNELCNLCSEYGSWERFEQVHKETYNNIQEELVEAARQELNE